MAADQPHHTTTPQKMQRAHLLHLRAPQTAAAAAAAAASARGPSRSG
jgi:hypothetical protein